MESGEEFVVVDDHNIELDALITLFKSSTETLNKLNFIMQTQIKTALSFNLKNVPPKEHLSYDNLLKKCNFSNVQQDELCREYMRDLLSTIVTTNEEKDTLRVNMDYLTNQLQLKSKEEKKWKEITSQLIALESDLRDVETISGSTSVKAKPNISDELTGDNVLVLVKDLCNRMKNLKTGFVERFKTDSASMDPSLQALNKQTQTGSNVIIHSDPKGDEQSAMYLDKKHIESELLRISKWVGNLSTSDVCPSISECSFGNDNRGFMSSRESFVNESIGEPQNEPTVPVIPAQTYTAEQEIPRCPICEIYLNSRDDLEDHIIRRH